MSAYLANPRRDRIHPFLSNVAEIRRRPRQHIEEGAATAGHATDREAVLRLLNAALATALVCALRYRRYAVMDTQAVADAVKNELMKRAQQEQSHSDQIAARIAIDTYREILRYLGGHDTATRRLIERILSVEQEHAEGLASMRESVRCQGGAAAVANHRSRPSAALR